MSTREEHRRDFNEWLEQVLNDNQFCSTSFDKVLNHLASCMSASALLMARDDLCKLLTEEMESIDLSVAMKRLSISSKCEQLSDEIVARYYLTDCNSEERASVDSGVDEEQQPRLLQQIPIALTPIHNNDSGNISNDDSPGYDQLFYEERQNWPKFVTPRGHLPQPPMLKVGSLPTRIGPGYYPHLPGRNCVAAYRNKTRAQIESKPINVNRARVLSATYDNSDLHQFYTSPRSNSISSAPMPMGFVQPTVCDMSSVMRSCCWQRRSQQKSNCVQSTAPQEQRLFAPIRSDSMQWAYDEVATASTQNQSEIFRPQATQPPVQSFLATLAQRQAPITPKIDDANAKREDDEFLSFVGGIAAHQPLCDADDE